MYYLSIFFVIISHTTRPILTEPSKNQSEGNTEAYARPELQKPNQPWNNGSSPIGKENSSSIIAKTRLKRSAIGLRLIKQLGITELEMDPRNYVLYPCSFPRVSDECLFFAPKPEKAIYNMDISIGYSNITVIKYKDLPEHIELKSKLHDESKSGAPIVIITGVLANQHTDQSKKYTTYSCILWYQREDDGFGMPCLLITNQLENVTGYHDIEMEASKLGQVCIGTASNSGIMLADEMEKRDDRGQLTTSDTELIKLLYKFYSGNINGLVQQRCLLINPPNCTKEFVDIVEQLNEQLHTVVTSPAGDQLTDVVGQDLRPLIVPLMFELHLVPQGNNNNPPNPFRPIIATLKKLLHSCGRSKGYNYVLELIDVVRVAFDEQPTTMYGLSWQNSSIHQTEQENNYVKHKLLRFKRDALNYLMIDMQLLVSSSQPYLRAINYKKLRYGQVNISRLRGGIQNLEDEGYLYSDIAAYLTKVPDSTIDVFTYHLDQCSSNTGTSSYMLGAAYIKSFINFVTKIAPERRDIWEILMRMAVSSNVLPAIEQKLTCFNLRTIGAYANHTARTMLSSKDPVIFDLISNITADIKSFDKCSEPPFSDFVKEYVALNETIREILGFSSKDDLNNASHVAILLMKLDTNLIDSIAEIVVNKLNISDLNRDVAGRLSLAVAGGRRMRMRCRTLLYGLRDANYFLTSLIKWHDITIISMRNVKQIYHAYVHKDRLRPTRVVFGQIAVRLIRTLNKRIKSVSFRQNVLDWQSGKPATYLRQFFAGKDNAQLAEPIISDKIIPGHALEFFKHNQNCTGNGKADGASVFVDHLINYLGMYSNENDQLLSVLRIIGKSPTILNKISKSLHCSFISYGLFNTEAEKMMMDILCDSSVPSVLQSLLSAIAEKHIAIEPAVLASLSYLSNKLPNDQTEQQAIGNRFAHHKTSKAKRIIEEIMKTIRNDQSTDESTEKPTMIDSEVIQGVLVGFGHKVMNVYNRRDGTDSQNRFLERFLNGLALGSLESANHSSELRKVILNLQQLVSNEETSPARFGMDAAFQQMVMTVTGHQGIELRTLVGLIKEGLLNLPAVLTIDTSTTFTSTFRIKTLTSFEYEWKSTTKGQALTRQTNTNPPSTQISTAGPNTVVIGPTKEKASTKQSTVDVSTTVTDQMTDPMQESSSTFESSATSSRSSSSLQPTSVEQLTTTTEKRTKSTEVLSTTFNPLTTSSTQPYSTAARTVSILDETTRLTKSSPTTAEPLAASRTLIRSTVSKSPSTYLTTVAESTSAAMTHINTQLTKASSATSELPTTTSQRLGSAPPVRSSSDIVPTSTVSPIQKSKLVTTNKFRSTYPHEPHQATPVPSKSGGPLMIVVPFLKSSLAHDIVRGRSIASMIKPLKKNNYLVKIIHDIFSLQPDVSDVSLTDSDKKIAINYVNALVDQLGPHWDNGKDTSSLVRNLVADDKCFEHIAKSLKRQLQQGRNESANALASDRYKMLMQTPNKITDLLSTIADQFVKLPSNVIKSLDELETTLTAYQKTNGMSFQKIGRQLCKERTTASKNVLSTFKDAVSGIVRKGNKSAQLKIKRVVPNLLDLQSAITSFGKKLMAFQKKTTPNTYLNEVLLGLIQNALMENSLNSHLEDLQTAIDNIRNQNPSDIGWNAALNDVVNELAKQSDALLNHLNSGIGEMDKEDGDRPNWAAIVGICCAIIVVVVVVVLVVLYMRRKKVAEEELTMEPDDPDVSVRMLTITESCDPKSEETQSVTDITQDTENVYTVPEFDAVKNRTDQPKTQFISTQLETDSTGSADVTQGTQSSESDITQISVVGSPKIDQSQKIDLLKTQLSELTSGKSLRTNKSQRSDKEDLKSQMKSELMKSQIKSTFEQSKVVEKSKMEHLTQMSQLSEIKENKSVRPNDNQKSGVASIHIRFD